MSDLLIADEPTTALDVRASADPRIAEGSSGAPDMAMLFITHDLGIVRKIADRVSVMKNGKSWSKAPWAVFASPDILHTRPAGG
jgi:microcin C transport system ATP-binding protein